MKSQMTIGKKLTLAFSAMMAVLLCLAGSALWSVGNLGSQLDVSVNKTANKIELAGEIKGSVFEMGAGQRGVIMYSMLQDTPKADVARATFRAASSKLEKSLADIRPLLSTEAGRQAVETIRVQQGAWIPIYQEIEQACAAQRLDGTLTTSLDRTVSMAGEMQVASDDLLARNRARNKIASKDAEDVTSHSRWNAFFLIGLGLAVGGVVLWVVRGVSVTVRNLAGELGGGADQVASAAAQVASSSQALAQGSSEQAASLEETSASSEEINSMARKNTENSRAAAELVTRSQERFVATNQALEQTVVAMGEINTQSGKISKIIKVIDEIAFQTNILALNAAVEAARAGEAGMGFAVVADEVRNLAQRCAQAAKDTAELIEESVAKSKDGKAKVDQVAVAIHAITEESAKVKTLIDEVNVGSQEQSRGFEQIGKALTQMEQVTQTTAASAEEGASAAEELTAQSETLKDLVGRLTALVNTDGGVRRPVAGRSKAAESRRPAPIAGRKARSDSSLPALRAAVSSKSANGNAAVPVPVSGKAEKNAFPMEDDFQEF